MFFDLLELFCFLVINILLGFLTLKLEIFSFIHILFKFIPCLYFLLQLMKVSNRHFSTSKFSLFKHFFNFFISLLSQFFFFLHPVSLFLFSLFINHFSRINYLARYTILSLRQIKLPFFYCLKHFFKYFSYLLI